MGKKRGGVVDDITSEEFAKASSVWTLCAVCVSCQLHKIKHFFPWEQWTALEQSQCDRQLRSKKVMYLF